MSKNNKKKNSSKNTPVAEKTAKTVKKTEKTVEAEKTVKAEKVKKPKAPKPKKIKEVSKIKTARPEDEAACAAVEKPLEKNSPEDKKVNEVNEKNEKAVKAPKVKAPKPPKEPLPALRFGKELKERIFFDNPVFVKFIAAIPILGAATTLKNGILISAVLIITVVFLNMIMYPLDSVIPKRFKYPIEFVIAGILITPQLFAASHFIPTVTNLCEVYLPLTALCAIPMVETKYYKKRHGFARTTLMAAINGAGFAFVALIFSVLREIIGNGALYERPMPYGSDIKFPFIVYPAGAFILFGFIAALWKKMFGVKDKNKGEQ